MIISSNFFCITFCCEYWCVSGDINFAEFVQYVVHEWSSGKSLNIHWLPQYQHCNPCIITFDFIGRFENLHQDAKRVMSELTTADERKSNITFPSLNVNMYASRASLKHAFANLSRNVMQKLVRIYKVDYELFGYDYQWACNNC